MPRRSLELLNQENFFFQPARDTQLTGFIPSTLFEPSFKLALAVTRAMGGNENVVFGMLDLVALATIADIAPLRGENRVFARYGLRMLAETKNLGLRALSVFRRLRTFKQFKKQIAPSRQKQRAIVKLELQHVSDTRTRNRA